MVLLQSYYMALFDIRYVFFGASYFPKYTKFIINLVVLSKLGPIDAWRNGT